MTKGTCKWFNVKRGFGFIKSDNPEDGDLFVHHTSIRGDGRRSLWPGDRVAFELGANRNGPIAVDVAPIVTEHRPLPPRRY